MYTRENGLSQDFLYNLETVLHCGLFFATFLSRDVGKDVTPSRRLFLRFLSIAHLSRSLSPPSLSISGVDGRSQG